MTIDIEFREEVAIHGSTAVAWLVRSGRDLDDTTRTLGTGGEATDETRRACRSWAVATQGTLSLLFETVDPEMLEHLGVLMRAGTPAEALSDATFHAHRWLADLQLGLGGEPSGLEDLEPMCPLCGYLCYAQDIDRIPELGYEVYGLACSRPAPPNALGQCGEVLTLGRAWLALLGPEVGRELAWFRRTRERRGQAAPVFCPGTMSPGEGIFSFADVHAVVPRTLGTVHDELLSTLGAMARAEESVGAYARLSGDDTALALATGHRDLDYHLDELVKSGLVEDRGPAPVSRLMEGRDPEVRLTSEGWQRVEELERGAVEKPNQGFVAMWFDPDMESVYKAAIEPAIEDAGYDAMQMAFLEHNDDITDRIIAEIRKSRFVVADFTGNRGGVYFEAGFALGLGKTVIWTCRRDYFESEGVHFDTQARNHILWDEPEDLRRSLRARIEATVPRGDGR